MNENPKLIISKCDLTFTENSTIFVFIIIQFTWAKEALIARPN